MSKKVKKTPKSVFKWKEWVKYRDEELEKEFEESGEELPVGLTWTNCIHQALMDRRLKFFVGGGLAEDLGFNDFLVVLSPIMFGTFTELYPIIREGLKNAGRNPYVIFKATWKNNKTDFFLDLIDENMTLCFLDDR